MEGRQNTTTATLKPQAMGVTMADLGAMREFHKHWEAYVADEQAAALLRARPPLDVAALTPADRARPMLEQPASAAYDEHALHDALARVQSTSHPSTDAPRDTLWGWWLDDPVWSVMGELRHAMAARDAAHARLAGLALSAAQQIDADEAYSTARASIASYLVANEEDERVRDDLAARCAEVTAQPPVPAGFFARLKARIMFALVGRRRQREEQEALDRRMADVQARMDLRAREITRLEETVTARRFEVESAVEEALATTTQELAAIEEHIVALLDDDLTRRDATYEPGSLIDLPFDEAFAQANDHEWCVLAAWMGAYAAHLPEVLERVSNAAASEAVWLEGHAPYGKRYWPLTPEVVALMESGRAHASNTALNVVLQRV